MKYSLTTSRQTIIDSASIDRVYVLTAGVFSTAVAVYISIGRGSPVDVILSSGGTTHVHLAVPANTEVEAFTDAGTAELAVMKQTCVHILKEAE